MYKDYQIFMIITRKDIIIFVRGGNFATVCVFKRFTAEIKKRRILKHI